MELTKKLLHMDRTKCEAAAQVSLEEDINIPDAKPDVSQIVFERGEALIDEVRPGTDSVILRGAVLFRVLYQSSEEGEGLVSLGGKLPFEEKVMLRGCVSGDTVEVSPVVEDLTVGMINSRKLNVASLLTLSVCVEEIADEFLPTEVSLGEGAEYCKQPMTVTQLAICKKDIFRVKEEASLPNGFPNGVQILWDSVTLQDITFRCVEEQLEVTGDVKLFVLYEGEGEKHPIRSFETVFHIRGEMECHGCKEGMLSNITYTCGHREVSLVPDTDGEMRNLDLDVVLDIKLKLYQEEETGIVTDIYSTMSEVTAVDKEGLLCKVLCNVTGKSKVMSKETIRDGNILQLLHAEATVFPEQQTIVGEGVKLQGSIQVKLLYITGQDETPYGHCSATIPYTYLMDIPAVPEQDLCVVQADIDQLQAAMLDGENVEIKAMLSFAATVFRKLPIRLIDSLEEAPLLPEKRKSLPGMAIYVVKDGDSLWSIGKKYYVPVESLRKINGLEKDELVKGQKILVMKG